jgi:GNAT superfamily N-acetyltransferase
MNGTIEVRGAVRGDSGEIADLLRQLGYQRTAEEIERGLNDPAHDVVVAVRSGSVVGVLVMVTRWQMHRGGSTCSIDALVIDERHRGTGAGSTLLAEAERRARLAGALAVDLHSNRQRREAHQFYERAGYSPTSTYFIKEHERHRADPMAPGKYERG